MVNVMKGVNIRLPSTSVYLSADQNESVLETNTSADVCTNDLFCHKISRFTSRKPTWWLSHTLHFMSSPYWRVGVMLLHRSSSRINVPAL